MKQRRRKRPFCKLASVPTKQQYSSFREEVVGQQRRDAVHSLTIHSGQNSNNTCRPSLVVIWRRLPCFKANDNHKLNSGKGKVFYSCHSNNNRSWRREKENDFISLTYLDLNSTHHLLLLLLLWQ